ncbi:MAG: hypothetical protein NPIRA02_07020 [Nitrospirales bacterium]|nr:MAG: hypothetical protein NPIRA02_07020 [Nitrospirales bacterium]
MRTIPLAFLLLVTSIGLEGCQLGISALVDRDELIKSANPASMKVNLLATARDVRPSQGNHAGRHTFTLFMIPTFEVKVQNGALNQTIPAYLKEGLESSGYDVTMVNELSQADGPSLVVQIDELKNNLFSWLYPLGIVTGGAKFCLALVDSDGKTMWVRETEGNSGVMLSLLYMSGFETRVKDDLTTNLSQMLQIVGSDEFKSVLRNAQAS